MEKVIRGDLHDKKPTNENQGPTLLAPSVPATNNKKAATSTDNTTTKRQSRIPNEDDDPNTSKKLLGNSDAALLNFQRASCTLDASIKIWSYRVDDVWNSSYRVLENLTRKNNGKDDDNNNNEEDIGDKITQEVLQRARNPSSSSTTTTSSRTGATSTIEKNIHSITTKRIEADYDVDPLFHKLSADNSNNDGGASGMLLNRLSVYKGCDLAFDSTETFDIDNIPGTDYTLINNTLSNEDSKVLHTDLLKSVSKADVISAEFVYSMLTSQVFTPSLELLYNNLYTYANAIGDNKTISLLNQHKNTTNNNNTSSYLLQQLDPTNKDTKKNTSTTDTAPSAWSAVAILTERMESNNNNHESSLTNTVGSSSVSSPVVASSSRTSLSSTSSIPAMIISTAAIPMDDLTAIDDVLANAVPVTTSTTESNPSVNDNGNDDNWVGGFEPSDDYDTAPNEGATTTTNSNPTVLGIAGMAPASSGAVAEYTFVDLSALSNAVATGTNSNQSMNHWKLRTAAIEAANKLESNTTNNATDNTKDNNGTKSKKSTKRKGTFTINFGPENKIPSDAFSKAKVPLAVGANKGAKGNTIVRDAEQMTAAALEKCEKNNSINAYLLPKIRQHIDPITLRNTGLFALTEQILSLTFKPQIRMKARTMNTTMVDNTGVVGNIFFSEDKQTMHTGFNQHLHNDHDDFGGSGGADFDDGGYDDVPMITSSSAASVSTITNTDNTTTTNHDGPIELIPAGRQVEKIRVRYETVAKRVDVAALKSDMLHLLCPETNTTTNTKSNAISALKLRSISHKTVENDFRTKARANEKNFTDTSGAAVDQSTIPTSTTSNTNGNGAQFSDAIRALAPDMSSQVTVPFYFITLLHLANEHGLALNGRNDLSDFEIGKLTP